MVNEDGKNFIDVDFLFSDEESASGLSGTFSDEIREIEGVIEENKLALYTQLNSQLDGMPLDNGALNEMMDSVESAGNELIQNIRYLQSAGGREILRRRNIDWESLINKSDGNDLMRDDFGMNYPDVLSLLKGHSHMGILGDVRATRSERASFEELIRRYGILKYGTNPPFSQINIATILGGSQSSYSRKALGIKSLLDANANLNHEEMNQDISVGDPALLLEKLRSSKVSRSSGKSLESWPLDSQENTRSRRRSRLLQNLDPNNISSLIRSNLSGSLFHIIHWYPDSIVGHRSKLDTEHFWFRDYSRKNLKRLFDANSDAIELDQAVDIKGRFICFGDQQRLLYLSWPDCQSLVESDAWVSERLENPNVWDDEELPTTELEDILRTDFTEHQKTTGKGGTVAR